jgi:cytidylate kinase
MAEGGEMTSEEIAQRLRPAIVAIDGPAAAGKSTIGDLLAQALDYLFLDTGAFYRAVTWAALARGCDIGDSKGLGALAETAHIEIRPAASVSEHGRNYTVWVDGVEVTTDLRRPEVDQNVSAVSAVARVRDALGMQQRRVGLHYGSGRADKAGIVMVGRDIGTVIVPDAPLKIFLDAKVEERAQRRFLELVENGAEVSYEQVLADMIERDRYDSGRDLAPLRAAPDGIVVDASGLTPEEVVRQILQIAAKVIARGRRHGEVPVDA